MSELSDKGKTLKAWADIVIERWEDKVKDQHIVNTGELLKSFTSQLNIDSSGNKDKIIFTYAYYGRFSELGVGKYVKIGTPSNRQKKPWYSKTFFSQVNKLAEIMAEKYSINIPKAVVEIWKK